MTTLPYIAIGGTWAWNGSSKGQWYDVDSPFSANMRLKGFEHYHVLGNFKRPYIWTTDLEGNQWWRRLIGRPADHTEWQAAGANLFVYCDLQIKPCELNIICHSHAAQVVAFACADGLKVHTLITVGSPIRADMLEVYRRARPNIGFHWHFHSDASDRFQWLGAIGDSWFSFRHAFSPARRHPYADQNVGVPGVGHSNILNDMTLFHDVWCGPIDLMKARHGRPDHHAT